MQKAGQAALASYGLPGAFVAIDPRNGEVIGLGSNPSFNPNIFTKPVSNDAYKRLTSEDNHAPLTDRATQGAYPTGSTFKLVTSVATLESGLLTPSRIICDPGSYTLGGITFKNAEGAAHGCINLDTALQVSDDVFFYKLGVEADNKGGDILQKWARKLGFGHKTGIDLPDEHDGHVPTPAWRNRLYKKKLTDRPWSAGDALLLATGQGDLQADPLQLAVAYSAVSNGGHVVTPHLGMRVEDNEGKMLQRIQPGPRRNIDLSAPDAQRRHVGTAAGDPGRRHRGQGVRGLPGARPPARPARPCGPARATSPGTSAWRPPTIRRSSSRRRSSKVATGPTPPLRPPARSSPPTSASRARRPRRRHRGTTDGGLAR